MQSNSDAKQTNSKIVHQENGNGADESSPQQRPDKIDGITSIQEADDARPQNVAAPLRFDDKCLPQNFMAYFPYLTIQEHAEDPIMNDDCKEFNELAHSQNSDNNQIHVDSLPNGPIFGLTNEQKSPQDHPDKTHGITSIQEADEARPQSVPEPLLFNDELCLQNFMSKFVDLNNKVANQEKGIIGASASTQEHAEDPIMNDDCKEFNESAHSQNSDNTQDHVDSLPNGPIFGLTNEQKSPQDHPEKTHGITSIQEADDASPQSVPEPLLFNDELWLQNFMAKFVDLNNKVANQEKGIIGASASTQEHAEDPIMNDDFLELYELAHGQNFDITQDHVDSVSVDQKVGPINEKKSPQDHPEKTDGMNSSEIVDDARLVPAVKKFHLPKFLTRANSMKDEIAIQDYDFIDATVSSQQHTENPNINSDFMEVTELTNNQNFDNNQDHVDSVSVDQKVGPINEKKSPQDHPVKIDDMTSSEIVDDARPVPALKELCFQKFVALADSMEIESAIQANDINDATVSTQQHTENPNMNNDFLELYELAHSQNSDNTQDHVDSVSVDQKVGPINEKKSPQDHPEKIDGMNSSEKVDDARPVPADKKFRFPKFLTRANSMENETAIQENDIIDATVSTQQQTENPNMNSDFIEVTELTNNQNFDNNQDHVDSVPVSPVEELYREKFFAPHNSVENGTAIKENAINKAILATQQHIEDFNTNKDFIEYFILAYGQNSGNKEAHVEALPVEQKICPINEKKSPQDHPDQIHGMTDTQEVDDAYRQDLIAPVSPVEELCREKFFTLANSMENEIDIQENVINAINAIDAIVSTLQRTENGNLYSNFLEMYGLTHSQNSDNTQDHVDSVSVDQKVGPINEKESLDKIHGMPSTQEVTDVPIPKIEMKSPQDHPDQIHAETSAKKVGDVPIPIVRKKLPHRRRNHDLVIEQEFYDPNKDNQSDKQRVTNRLVKKFFTPINHPEFDAPFWVPKKRYLDFEATTVLEEQDFCIQDLINKNALARAKGGKLTRQQRTDEANIKNYFNAISSIIKSRKVANDLDEKEFCKQVLDQSKNVNEGNVSNNLFLSKEKSLPPFQCRWLFND